MANLFRRGLNYIKRKVNVLKLRHKNKLEFDAVLKTEMKREWKAYVNEKNILLLAHSLEKGMGIENPRIGFGRKKAEMLISEINVYASCSCDLSDKYIYSEAMSVLDSYIRFSLKNGTDVSELLNEYDKLLNKYGTYTPLAAGYNESNSSSLYEDINYDSILNFFSSRHSIRSYDKRSVSQDDMDKVLSLASRAPSACNRQTVKVFWTNDKEKVDKINEYVPGNQGFENAIPNWAIIAADRDMFGEKEALQWYIDGGIFVSHLILAFHACKIGCCVFQLPIALENMDKIRSVASIPDNFDVVCAVGFGYAKENVKYLSAARKPVSDYAVRF